MKRLLVTVEFWLIAMGMVLGAFIGNSGAIPWIPARPFSLYLFH